MEANLEPAPRFGRIRKNMKYALLLLFAMYFGYTYKHHVANLFESNSHYSHLSDLEREMYLYSEMGFYYSFYKTMVESDSNMIGVSKLMYDKYVEYPNEVNDFNRFNVHPEVAFATLYRYLEPTINNTAYKECYVIDRGENVNAVESCIGIGEPIFFYLECIFWISGFSLAVLFLYSTILCESILAGIVAVIQYLANLDNITRVTWAPNQRENIACPLLLLQMFLITLQLKDKQKKHTFELQVAIFVVNTLCLVTWQFSQFVFLTQICIFFFMEQIKIIDLKTLCVLMHSHFCGIHTAVLLLQGNSMLKSSLYVSTFVTISAYCLFFSTLRIKIHKKSDLFIELWLVCLRIGIVVLSSCYIKKLINDFLEADDDSHVWDILMSKFLDFKNFHVSLYTCSAAFDFIPGRNLKDMFLTLLIPMTILSGTLVSFTWSSDAINKCIVDIDEAIKEDRRALKKKKKQAKTKEDGALDNKQDAENKLKKDNLKVKEDAVEVKEDAVEVKEDAVNVKEDVVDVKEDNVNYDTDDSGIDKEEQFTDLDELNEKIKRGIQIRTDKLPLFILIMKNYDIEPAAFYNWVQTVVFGVMAFSIMRLQVLWVPQMCVYCGMLLNKNFHGKTKRLLKWVSLAVVLCHIPVAYIAARTFIYEDGNSKTYSNLPLEELLQWVMTSTEPTAAFAGSISLLPTIMLAARRPIVAHSHYEHLESRQRSYTVNKMYGRFTPLELYRDLTKLKATFLVVETQLCYQERRHQIRKGKRASELPGVELSQPPMDICNPRGVTDALPPLKEIRNGCTFLEIWDYESPELKDNQPLCHTLLTRPTEHMYPAFRSAHYAVFRLHEYGIRYMPRSFDS